MKRRLPSVSNATSPQTTDSKERANSQGPRRRSTINALEYPRIRESAALADEKRSARNPLSKALKPPPQSDLRAKGLCKGLGTVGRCFHGFLADREMVKVSSAAAAKLTRGIIVE